MRETLVAIQKQTTSKMKLLFKFLLLSILFSPACYSQNEPHENIKGIWVKGKDGINVENDKIVLLKKNDDWNAIESKTAIYKFLKEPIINEPYHFRIWVMNDVVNKRIINREKKDEQTTQYRIFDLKIDEKGKLTLLLSELLSTNEYDKGGYWEHFPNYNKIRTRFTFKRLKQQ